MSPIELRISRTSKASTWKITAVYPGICNTSVVGFVSSKKEATDWCKKNHSNVPRLYD